MIPLCTRPRGCPAPVRVGVGVVGGAVGGPAGVADAGRRGGQRRLLERLLEVGQLARPLVRGDRPVVDQGDAGRVVAAVLQSPQPLDHDVARLLAADVPDDSAHARSLGVLGPPAPAGRVRGLRTHLGWRACPTERIRRELAVCRARPRRLGGAGPCHRAATQRRGDRPRPRPGRRARPRGGAAGLPAPVAPAQPVRRVGGQLHRATEDFLHQPQPPRTPFVIGLAGSVAVGKSTTARVLQHMLAHWPEHPRVSLVTTDGFLLPTPSSSGAACSTARASRSPTTDGPC